jgi:hypothetical protein
MHALFARVFAILLALQPWAFGMFAAPRAKGSSTSSLSSPSRDQTMLDSIKTVAQLPSATRDTAIAPEIVRSLQAPKYGLVGLHTQTSSAALSKCLLARYGRWLE